MNHLENGISIVICCYNSEKVIEKTISSISKQETSCDLKYELIIVDNNCSDNSISLIQKNHNHPQIRLKIVKEKKAGLLFARLKGVATANYKYLLFLDDDNELSSQWLIPIYKLFEQNSIIGAIGGLNKLCPIGSPISKELLHYEGVYACGPQAHTINPNGTVTNHLWGAGLAIRTELIKEIYSVPEYFLLIGRTGKKLLRGDDSELALSVKMKGYELYYCSKLTINHNILSSRLTWEYIKQVRFNAGQASIILEAIKNCIKNVRPKHPFREVSGIILHLALATPFIPSYKGRFKWYFTLGRLKGFITLDRSEVRAKINNKLQFYQGVRIEPPEKQ